MDTILSLLDAAKKHGSISKAALAWQAQEGLTTREAALQTVAKKAYRDERKPT